jgi:hypothetical protein
MIQALNYNHLLGMNIPPRDLAVAQKRAIIQRLGSDHPGWLALQRMFEKPWFS